MAIAGDMNHIPSMPISLGPDGRVQRHSWVTNKPRGIVEQDIERAVQRLLDGETFEMHCSGPQVARVQACLDILLHSYPAQRIGNEPAPAAAIRQQIAAVRERMAQGPEEERRAAKAAIYRLSAEWWREVRR